MIIRELILNEDIDLTQYKELIESRGLKQDVCDISFGAFEHDKLVGTVSVQHNILKILAIDDYYIGQNISSDLILHATNYLYEKGVKHYFVYTQRCNVDLFKSLNFNLITSYKGVYLLEGGITSIDKYISNTKSIIEKYTTSSNLSSIVINANPMTLGHKHLISTTSNTSEFVIVFVLQQDDSIFNFETRFSIVKKVCKQYPNVLVLPSSEYIISNITFPTYFMKDEGDVNDIHINIDANIYNDYFSKLGIKTRYVGEEPTCIVTENYINTLELAFTNIELIRIPRLEINNIIVSASTVRKLLSIDEQSVVKQLVPVETYEYITSNESISTMNLIKQQNYIGTLLELKDSRQLIINKYQRIFALKTNYPGIIKNNKYTYYIVTYFNTIFSKLPYLTPIYFNSEHENFVLYTFKYDSLELKNYSIVLEDIEYIGRLVDLDVYIPEPISRSNLNVPPRKCYVCYSNAHECTRSSKHDMSELQSYFAQNTKLHHLKNFLRDIIYNSCLEEFEIDLKFGLVGKDTKGSHKDMDYSLFEMSAMYLSDKIPTIIESLDCTKSIKEQYIFAKEQGVILENAMFEITNGVNTYKGLLFNVLLYLISYKNSVYNNKSISENIIEFSKYTINNYTENSAGHKLSKQKLLGVREHSLNGYSIINDPILYNYTSNPSKYKYALLYILTKINDTNVIKKTGVEEYKNLQSKIKNILKSGDEEDITALHNYFIDNNLSPGGSADIFILHIMHKKITNLSLN